MHASQEIDGQRASSLRFGDPRVQALLAVLLVFAFLPNGFDNRMLRERVAPLLGKEPGQWKPGRTTYDLRRLRLRGLIERVPGTRRYQVTAEGRRTALCYHRTSARVLRPALSVACGPEPDHPVPLSKAVKLFDREIDRLWKGHCVAA